MNMAQDKTGQFERNISKWILGVIAFFFLLVILAEIAVAAGWLENAPIDSLFDVCKAIFLPIVTLVLGHYFGARSQQNSQ
jgi:mannitol-specific phosphotransferase system IIBC component